MGLSQSKLDSVGEESLSPLLRLCKEGKVDEVRRLIESGANIETKNRNGSTPLMIACGKGHESIVRLLIEKGADIEAQDNDGWNALMIASLTKGTSIAELLLERGANIEAHDHVEAMTCLMIACERGNESLVRLLFDKGANIEALDATQTNPLLFACSEGHESIVKFLIERGAKIDLKNVVGISPLMMASERGHESIVRILIENGANIHSFDSGKRKTCLMIACENGRESVVRLLIEMKVDVEARDENGMTALMFACKNGHESIARYLIDNGAIVSAKDNKGRTAFKWSFSKSSVSQSQSFRSFLKEKESNSCPQTTLNQSEDSKMRTCPKGFISPKSQGRCLCFNNDVIHDDDDDDRKERRIDVLVVEDKKHQLCDCVCRISIREDLKTYVSSGNASPCCCKLVFNHPQHHSTDDRKRDSSRNDFSIIDHRSVSFFRDGPRKKIVLKAVELTENRSMNAKLYRHSETDFMLGTSNSLHFFQSPFFTSLRTSFNSFGSSLRSSVDFQSRWKIFLLIARRKF